jgi:hypothetical protein
MLVFTDFDYHENKADFHGILYAAATSQTGQNWIHLSPISELIMPILLITAFVLYRLISVFTNLILSRLSNTH